MWFPFTVVSLGRGLGREQGICESGENRFYGRQITSCEVATDVNVSAGAFRSSCRVVPASPLTREVPSSQGEKPGLGMQFAMSQDDSGASRDDDGSLMRGSREDRSMLVWLEQTESSSVRFTQMDVSPKVLELPMLESFTFFNREF